MTNTIGYYWHRFFAHQSDLNYDNPAVWEAIFPVVDFWLGMGVDGLRLDAVPYLYERDGTSSENLFQTHQFLRALRRHIDTQFPHRMLLAEANQWPEDACAYFGQGDECHMAFHFPLMPRLFMAIHTADRLPILDILAQTPPIPESCQWALFLRNHDELTLEMVSEEERCYLYLVCAQDRQARINLGIRRRLAPLLGNNRQRIELMHGLLFSLPGTPVLYYGDEIGMGDNIYLGDRHGVRTPMQWSPDMNAGFSRANPQQLYLPPIIDPEYHYQAINVAAQQDNPQSLWWGMKRLIALRKRYQAFSRGSLEVLHPDNPRILAFIRRYGDEILLVVANLSRFVQPAALDLAAFQGRTPVELSGRTAFPMLGRRPFFLTLAPYAFYWFALETQGAATAGTGATGSEAQVPVLTVPGGWEDVLRSPGKTALEEILPAYLQACHWFNDTAQSVEAVTILETVPLAQTSPAVSLTLLRVENLRGVPQIYGLPVACAAGEEAERLLEHAPQGAIAHVQGADDCRLLYDAFYNPAFCLALLQRLASGKDLHADDSIVAWTREALEPLLTPEGAPPEPTLLETTQSNTLIAYGNRLILKCFRRLTTGINPEMEVGRFLTERRCFRHIPPVLGTLEYQPRGRGEAMTLAVLQGYVPHHGNAWQSTLAALEPYFAKARTMPIDGGEILLTAPALLALTEQDVPPLAQELIGSYLEFVRRLGQRTAELHLALASAPEEASFAPEPFSPLTQRALYQSMRGLTVRVWRRLGEHWKHLPASVRAEAQVLLESQDTILQRFQIMLGRKITALRIRCHGNYHLQQILCMDGDVALIDFEGEPARLLEERQLKRCALLDVVCMLRSFHYAAYAARGDQVAQQGPTLRTASAPLEHWTRFWCTWVSGVFLQAYLEQEPQMTFLPQTREELTMLCDVYLLEKVVYEIGYELEHRPAWVQLPLQTIRQLLGLVS